MALYDEMQQLMREIAADPDFKQGLTQLIQMVPGSGPVDDPGPGTQVVTDLDGFVRGVKFKYVASGLAVASDLQITHSVVPGIVPTMRDFIRADGVTYKITQVLPAPAVGVPVKYTLIIQKGGV